MLSMKNINISTRAYNLIKHSFFMKFQSIMVSFKLTLFEFFQWNKVTVLFHGQFHGLRLFMSDVLK